MTLYLYGFVAPTAPAPPEGLTGVAGAPVELLPLGSVHAVVSHVPSEAFTEARLQERMRDLEWLAEQGALHERVVTWFVDHAAILPARLLTLHSAAAALAEALPDRGASLARELERFSRVREWDLKVSYRPEVVKARIGELSEAVRAVEREMDAAPPGRRYLLERKRARLAAEQASSAARAAAERLHLRLDPSAERSLPLPIPRESAEHPVVLNVAYLVAREREEELAALAAEEGRRLEALGFHVGLSGPWAPYRFITTGSLAPGGAGG